MDTKQAFDKIHLLMIKPLQKPNYGPLQNQTNPTVNIALNSERQCFSLQIGNKARCLLYYPIQYYNGISCKKNKSLAS